MPAPARKPITKAVVDTGPLFIVLTLNYLQMIQAPEVKRERILAGAADRERERYLFERSSHREAYRQLFESIRDLLTTSHVIGELQGLHGRLRLSEEDVKSFWSSSLHYLSRKNMDERLLRLVDMHARKELSEAVCLIGPTDTGLIELARQEGCVLLTNDERTLARRAWEIGVDCRLVKDVIDWR